MRASAREIKEGLEFLPHDAPLEIISKSIQFYRKSNVNERRTENVCWDAGHRHMLRISDSDLGQAAADSDSSSYV